MPKMVFNEATKAVGIRSVYFQSATDAGENDRMLAGTRDRPSVQAVAIPVVSMVDQDQVRRESCVGACCRGISLMKIRVKPDYMQRRIEVISDACKPASVGRADGGESDEILGDTNIQFALDSFDAGSRRRHGRQRVETPVDR